MFIRFLWVVLPLTYPTHFLWATIKKILPLLSLSMVSPYPPILFIHGLDFHLKTREPFYSLSLEIKGHPRALGSLLTTPRVGKKPSYLHKGGRKEKTYTPLFNTPSISEGSCIWKTKIYYWVS